MFTLSTPSQEDADFTFGFAGLWVVAPERPGPHNWEDVGLRAVLGAIDTLAAAEPAADASRLVVHGHSRGGHGAWALATRLADRVLGVAVACGWYSREEYGDANNLWVHETSLMHADKTLVGVLHASVAENDNALHASTLRGLPALVRVGTHDQAVPAWFGRRMARVLQEHGAEVEFDEQPQGHWWWDTLRPNDGGVMHDDRMRNWTLRAARRPAAAAAALRATPATTIAASSPEYEGRHGVRVLQRGTPASRATVRVRLGAADGAPELTTTNVHRLAIGGATARAALAAGGALRVDGDTIRLDGEAWEQNTGHGCAADDEPTECCRDEGGGRGRWRVCAAAALRPPHLLGPIRRVFAAPWLVVVADDASALEVRLASYVVSGHQTAVGTSTHGVLRAGEAAALRPSHRFVFLGVHAHRRFAPGAATGAWPLAAAGEGGALSVHGCTFGGPGVAAAFLAPSSAGGAAAHLDLVVTATDGAALALISASAFTTNQPHTRAPFSNMLPDYVVVGPEFEWQGHGGVRAAGFFDAAWGVAEGSFASC